jgi:uncharacterized protein (TIGR02466 family)
VSNAQPRNHRRNPLATGRAGISAHGKLKSGIKPQICEARGTSIDLQTVAGHIRMVRSLFVTNLYEAEIGDPALLRQLAHSIRSLASDDKAGRNWSKEHRYAGYTSYASLNDLPRRDPAFADLAKLLAGHAATFAQESSFDGARKPKLDSLWVNLLKSSGQHSGHIHPHSTISGTMYVEVPKGSGPIRFEDPRLPLMMAAPQRPDTFVTVQPRTGLLLMWESWLRHEVLAGSGRGERLSISFNFA